MADLLVLQLYLGRYSRTHVTVIENNTAVSAAAVQLYTHVLCVVAAKEQSANWSPAACSSTVTTTMIHAPWRGSKQICQLIVIHTVYHAWAKLVVALWVDTFAFCKHCRLRHTQLYQARHKRKKLTLRCSLHSSSTLDIAEPSAL